MAYISQEYTLAKISDGKDGIGKPGENGKTLYTWIVYANDLIGTGLSNNYTGQKYMGVAYNKETVIESTNASDYQFMLITGEDGVDGTDAYTIILQNENISFATNQSRVPLSAQNHTCEVVVMKGATVRTDFTIGSITKPAGITASVSGRVITISVGTGAALVGDSGSITVPITIDGKTFNKTISYSISIQGTKGDTGVSATNVILSKENCTFSANSSGQALPTTVITDVMGFVGANRSATTIGSITGIPSGMTMTVNDNGTSNATISVAVDSTLSALAVLAGIVNIPVTVNGITFAKKFSYSLSKAGSDGATGQNATSYWMVSSVAAISKSITGIFSPASITISGKSKTGTSTVVNYSGRFKIFINGSTTAVYTSSTNEESKTYAVPTGTTSIRCVMYQAGGTSVVLDEQTIPIVSDGTNGVDGNDGKGISSTEIKYQASTSGTSVPTGTWVTSIPSVAVNQYLWTRTVITYTDNTSSISYSIGKMGATGAAGNGISSITNYYLATASATDITTTTTGWTTTVQNMTVTNRYLWNYEVIEYTNGNSYTSTPVIIGVYGNTGASGTGYTVFLENENHTFPGSTTAAIAGSVSTKVIAYKNTSQIAATISKIGTVNVSGNQTGIATGITGITANVANNGTSTATITFNVTTALTTKNGIVPITMTVDGKTFVKNFSYALAMTGAGGATGTAAKSVDITATSQIFKSIDGGITFSPDTIKLTPIFQGGISFSMWQYSTNGGTSWINVTSGSNGLTVASGVLTIAKTCDLFTSTITALSFKCISNNTSYFDVMTVLKLYDVTDIQIGGRNLLLQSGVSVTNSSYPTKTYTMTEKMVLNQLYTCTVWGSLGEGKTSFSLYLDGGNIGLGALIKKTDGVYQLTFKGKTGTKDVSIIHVYPMASSVSASSTITKIKIEKGNKGTDWTPAPEDIDNQFEEVTTTMSGVSSKVNAVDKKITDKVWQSDITEKINNYNNTTIKTLTDRVTEAETDIDGIRTSVSTVQTEVAKKADGSTVTALTERVAKAEQDADGFEQTVQQTYATKDSLKNYSTTTQMNSAITQKADEINQSVSSIYETKENVAKISLKADQIEQTVEDNTGDISTLKQTATSYGNRIATAEGKVSTLEQTAESYGRKISTAEGKISTLEQTAESYGTRIENAEGKATALEQNINGFKQTVSNTYATNEKLDSVKKSVSEFIVGTQTGTTGTWLGNASFTSLVDGQQITYWLPYSGSGNATLNLTLASGTKTGAINCYYSGASRLTTHYPAGSTIRLTYRVNVTIGTSTTKYTGWWADANYNTDTYDRVRFNNSITAKTAISAARIIVGSSTGYFHLASSVAFDVTASILYAVSAIAASASGSNNYLSYPSVNVANNKSGWTGTAKKTCYIVGTLNGTTFTPNATLFTTAEPTSNDNLTYIALGYMATTTTMYLYPEHPMYRFSDGKFKSFAQIAIDAQLDLNSYKNTTNQVISQINQELESVEISVSKKQSSPPTAIRYIRDWLNGSSVNSENRWVKCKVMVDENNIADDLLAKALDQNGNQITQPANINVYTNGDVADTEFVTATAGKKCLQVDLGQVRKDIDTIHILHYHSDNRIFNHKLEVSSDGANWVTMYDSDVQGGYVENSIGKIYYISESVIHKNEASLLVSVGKIEQTINEQSNTINKIVSDAEGTTQLLTKKITETEQSIRDDLEKLPDKNYIQTEIATSASGINTTISDFKNDVQQAYANYNQTLNDYLIKFAKLGMATSPEVLKTAILMDIDGITVYQGDEKNEGNKTVLNTQGLYGYYNNQPIFQIDKDLTITERLRSVNGADFTTMKLINRIYEHNDGTKVNEKPCLVHVISGGNS